MKNNILKHISLIAMVALLFASCTKDLDRTPKYGSTSATLYKDLAGYKSVLAKVYAGLTLTGNSGPDGSGDISSMKDFPVTCVNTGQPRNFQQMRL